MFVVVLPYKRWFATFEVRATFRAHHCQFSFGNFGCKRKREDDGKDFYWVNCALSVKSKLRLGWFHYAKRIPLSVFFLLIIVLLVKLKRWWYSFLYQHQRFFKILLLTVQFLFFFKLPEVDTIGSSSQVRQIKTVKVLWLGILNIGNLRYRFLKNDLLKLIRTNSFETLMLVISVWSQKFLIFIFRNHLIDCLCFVKKFKCTLVFTFGLQIFDLLI